MFLVRVGGGKYVGEIYYFLQHITLLQVFKQRGVVVSRDVLVLTGLARDILGITIVLLSGPKKEKSKRKKPSVS